MVNIVLDTNCLISSLKRASVFYPVWRDFMLGKYCLCITDEILDEYQEIIEQRTGFAEIANNVISAILNRSNVRHIEVCYIEKYMAVLNAEKINRGFCAFCYISMKQHTYENSQRIMKAVQDIPEIVECYNVSGNYDFMLKIYVKDMKAYQDFVLQILGQLDCIGSLNSSFVLGEVKNTHVMAIPKE